MTVRAIITKQRDDGSYADVGMNTRTIMDLPATDITLIRRIQSLYFYTKGRRYRVEEFRRGIYKEPTAVRYFDL